VVIPTAFAVNARLEDLLQQQSQMKAITAFSMCVFYFLCVNVLSNAFVHQAGVSRSAQQTKERLQAQLNAAMHGVEKTVVDMQRATGTKDKVAQYWINILLEKARR
jgi:hypothetical protein